ncbi:hypothetical protein PVAP13_9KG010120 [Panicum virgatum]|uniref:Uncharacterized protein n=1 Tax=Panicum virgatum TaxID=38727 RepID=A0A8T0N410_PANVG|nr:hypothetical protein PVAP13_9KG010120 [Panicum virgatum]
MASGGRASRRRGRIYRCRGGSKRARSEGNGERICVRGHRITLVGRMRVDANGDFYVPDSVDEESGMVVDAGGVEMADFGAGLGAQMAPRWPLLESPPKPSRLGPTELRRMASMW